MHIAIEGMDGVGKTSQAKEVAQKLNYEFIAKSFHEMKNASGKHDNYITINEYTNGKIKGAYGLKQNYYIKKIRKENIVTDRFYISKYWAKAETMPISYFEEIMRVWGMPDVIILLYAKPEILRKRIYQRNSNDKDLYKVQKAEEAYELMINFAKKMFLNVIVIDTSNLTFNKTTDIILYAIKEGIVNCEKKFPYYCSVITPDIEKVKTNDDFFYTIGNRALACISDKEELVLPKSIHFIEEKCFAQCKNLRKLFISKNVKSISDFAFDDIELTGIEVDKDNKFYSSINGCLYNKEGTILIKYFGDRKKSTAVLPEKVKILGNKAFADCVYIKKIILPKGLLKIGYGVFCNCNKLKKIIFKENNLKRICAGSFAGCENLKKIVLSEKSKYYTEDNCIKVNGDILFYFGKLIKKNIYNVPAKSYIYPFAYANRLIVKLLIIPDSVKKIGAYAFKNDSIKNIILGCQCKEIGESSFSMCKVEKIRVLSNSVPEICDNTFEDNMEIVVNNNTRTPFLVEWKWARNKIKEFIYDKNINEVCGTACIRYIQSSETMSNYRDFIPNMYWIMELGTFLIINLGMDVVLKYYNSKLMDNYFNHNILKTKKAYKALCGFFRQGGKVFEEKVSKDNLVECLKKSLWVILNVRSDLLFNDNSFAGKNHFIILERCTQDEATIISPGKKGIYRMFLETENLMRMLENNGQWILVAGRRKNESE